MAHPVILGVAGITVVGLAAFRVLFPSDDSRHSNESNGWMNADHAARLKAQKKAERKAARKAKGRTDA
ncbi:hypothetical protein ACSMXM_02035 [Pacificimonas sp. ICDLI1SI03]|jgi:hypothetical protein|tara:strand:- start:30302 stop:30505 length:204 start_codon:yes stop_codon:yes gene_type:complete